MNNKIYILSDAYGDDEHDDIDYVYIEISEDELNKIKTFSSNFEMWRLQNPSLFNAKFFSPLSVYHLSSTDELEEFIPPGITANQSVVYLDSPLPGEIIEDCEPDWTIDDDYIYFCYSAGDFRVMSGYKYVGGFVSSVDFEISKLEEKLKEKECVSV